MLRGKSLRGKNSTAGGAVAKPKYYVVFVEDPNTRTPFHVVPASKITHETEKELSSHYLNNNRRKRSYITAFSPVFNYPCRVFSKAEPNQTVVKLNKLVALLNEKFKLLIQNNIDTDQAYDSLLEECPNKVRDGVDYMMGTVTNKRARRYAPPETASSYTANETETEVKGKGPLATSILCPPFHFRPIRKFLRRCVTTPATPAPTTSTPRRRVVKGRSSPSATAAPQPRPGRT